jgi:hypothetical protein
MTSEQWLQLKEIFHEAVLLGPEARSAFLRERCDGDAEMLRELQMLLESHDEAENFIEQPALASASEIFSIEGKDFWIGRTIGRYRILDEIGRGGMGVVYLAVRDDDEYRKQVAIKLIKRGMDTDAVLRRFRHERQILANLEHPNIARLLDGGTTEDGLPYFVMEYVEGTPIDLYSEERKLSADERLELFRQVCAAVTYAHQNLVIHRDLKPVNIIVTKEGDRHGSRHARADARIRQPGAAARRKTDDRDGRLQPRRHPLRAADWPSPIRDGRELAGRPGAHHG